MKAAVLGLGESLKEYSQKDNEVTFGVNDIFKHYPVDYLICVDRIHRFTPKRFEAISKSTHKKFYTHLEEWKGNTNNVQLIKLSGARGCLKNIESNNICYSNNSTFVATVLAYKHGAKEISIYGADFNTHPNFKDAKGDVAIQDFKNLFDYLKSKGVVINVANGSRLNEVL